MSDIESEIQIVPPLVNVRHSLSNGDCIVITGVAPNPASRADAHREAVRIKRLLERVPARTAN